MEVGSILAAFTAAGSIHIAAEGRTTVNAATTDETDSRMEVDDAAAAAGAANDESVEALPP